MSSIASFPTPAVTGSHGVSPAHKKTITPFEANSRQFGPVAASAIGVAQVAAGATAAAASSGYSFSSEGLKRLQNAIGDISEGAQDLWEGTTSAVGDMVDSVEEGILSSADEISGAYHDLRDSVERAYQYGQDLENAVSSSVAEVVDEISEAMGQVIDEAVDYVALGIAAFK